MSSIGDKKVALNLSDGTSVNLNKPTVLDSTVTSFLGLKNGEYCGVCTYTKSDTAHATIYMPSIRDFPDGSLDTDPGPTNYFLKVMDTIGDDESDSQIFYCRIGAATYSGIGYAPQPTSLNDESQTAAQTASNTSIIWARLTSYHELRYVENKIPVLTDGAYDPTSDYSKNDRAKQAINAHTTDCLADAINLHILEIGTDLNTLLTTGKYAIPHTSFIVNGPVMFTISHKDEGSKSVITEEIISDASEVPSTVDRTTGMPIGNGVLIVDYFGVDNGVTQTLICDQCIARRVITGLTESNDGSADQIIKRPDTATNYGPWRVYMSNGGVYWKYGLDDIPHTYAQQACSMTNAVHLSNRIKMLEYTQQHIDVVDDLTSTSTYDALSANQGKVLNDKISKLTKTDTVGSASNPVYMKNGAITAGTYSFSSRASSITEGSDLTTGQVVFVYDD